MAGGQLTRVVREIRRLAGAAGPGATDAQLLDSFVTRRDAGAFEALVVRHGPMVLRLCRQLLRHAHDAEDAFQATFLVLARKAASIRERHLLGNWLYGVAHRIAVRARAGAARGPGVEGQGAGRPPPGARPGRGRHGLAPVLHEELDRLAEKYRTPVVLCYLEGKTNEEAARQLRWPLGTVKGRLA